MFSVIFAILKCHMSGILLEDQVPVPGDQSADQNL
jgi:hypothetical protein